MVPYSSVASVFGTRLVCCFYCVSDGLLYGIAFFFQALARSLAPLGDRILVRRAAKETMTAGGILLPSDNAKSPNEGEVIAVGPGIRDVSGNLHAPTLKSGDSVLLPEYGGSKIKIDGDEMFLYREDDILGKYE